MAATSAERPDVEDEGLPYGKRTFKELWSVRNKTFVHKIRRMTRPPPVHGTVRRTPLRIICSSLHAHYWKNLVSLPS